ncbi:MAG: helix-turn-helix transcriptional regulator [Marinifilaceae bacterium]|nr:helix-turn-helix transcriptional regulator [Marinifilaceae bacterium]
MASIFSRQLSHISDQIFIFWLVLVFLAEITFFLSSQNLFEDFHWVYEFACGSHVLHGTVFYFYVLSLVVPFFKFERKHLLHLFPFAVYMGYKTTTKLLGLVDCLEEGGCSHSDNIYAVISVYMKFLIILVYVIAAYAVIWKIKEDEQFRKTNPYGVKWICSIGNGVVILLAAVFFIRMLDSYNVHFIIDQVMLINIIVSVFVISFVYIYTKYAYIFAHPFGNDPSSIKEVKTKLDVNSKQDEDQYSKICTYIEENDLFKDGDLTLRKLSSLIDIPEHTISQVINRVTDRSYSDFINAYRINFFLNQVENNAHEEQTLLYMAFECGFNSKSSFNRVFKQFHDVTPSEYIKSKGI